MHRLSGLFLTVLAMVALAVSGICPADDRVAPKLKDPPPATRRQFEKLFPHAIHYPDKWYYTLVINGSSAIVLHDEQDYIAAAIILTQAKRNAAKLAEVLHMSYDMTRTERGKRFHHAIIYNDRALYRDWPGVESENTTNRAYDPWELRPSFTILGSLAGILRDPDFLFYDWNRRGIVFTNQAHTDKVFVSAHNPQSPIVHFQTEDAFKHISSIFPYYPLSTFDQAQTKESKAIVRLSGLQQIERYQRFNSNDKLAIGTCKDGTEAIGRLSRKYPLDRIPPSAPKAFPKKRSEWPTITLAELQQENDKAASAEEKDEPPAATLNHTTDTPEKKKVIHLPLTPKEALDAYLKHLQSF